MAPETFRQLAHALVDRVADFLAGLPERPVTPHEPVGQVRALLGDHSLPEEGSDAGALLEEASRLLFDHSLLNGHPGFLGYITSSAAPIGILAELLAAAVNPNLGGWMLSPMASEIERQTVRWLAEMVGYPVTCGGLLTSGGNMANFIAMLAARRAKLPWDAQRRGMTAATQRPRLYASQETHTWLQKAADQYGFGTEAVRYVPLDEHYRMDAGELERCISEDAAAGDQPFLVIATAGSTSTGAIDPLLEIARLCRKHDLWLHVDGAYGAFAAALPDAPAELAALAEADSLALDPHKWLYAPLEAGSVLVRDGEALRDAFSYTPPYYKLEVPGEEAPIHYFEYGPQNSRGFRALKVWLGLRQVGRRGYERMITDDIELAREIYRLAEAHSELEALTHNLSITTFRYLPKGVTPGVEEDEAYLNDLNRGLLERLQGGGAFYPTHAILDGRYALRSCIVNFRTGPTEVEGLIETVVHLGRELDAAMRPGRA